MPMEDSYVYRFLITYLELPSQNGLGSKMVRRSMHHLKIGKKTVWYTIKSVSNQSTRAVPV